MLCTNLVHSPKNIYLGLKRKRSNEGFLKRVHRKETVTATMPQYHTKKGQSSNIKIRRRNMIVNIIAMNIKHTEINLF